MTTRITLGNLTVDRGTYLAWIDDEPIDLTYVEFELLHALAKGSQRVLTRDYLVQTVWREDPDGHARKLTVHISRLRKKLRNSHPYKIRTIPKRGYSLANVGHPASANVVPPLRPGRRLLTELS